MVMITLMQNRKRDTDVQNRLLDSVGEGEGGMFRENSMYIIYSETSPAQVGCMRQVLRPGALGRPRGIGWRGRWEGGSGWGIHITPWLIHVNVWQNPLQCCEVISLQLIKINGKKKILSRRVLQVALVVRNPLANAGDLRDEGLIPGLGRSPGGWHGNLL